MKSPILVATLLCAVSGSRLGLEDIKSIQAKFNQHTEPAAYAPSSALLELENCCPFGGNNGGNMVGGAAPNYNNFGIGAEGATVNAFGEQSHRFGEKIEVVPNKQMEPVKVEGPLPPRLAPRADRTYNVPPHVLQREDGKDSAEEEAYKIAEADAKAQEASVTQEEVVAFVEYAGNTFEPDTVPTTENEAIFTTGNQNPFAPDGGDHEMEQAVVEGAIPAKSTPKAGERFVQRPKIVESF